MTTELDTLARRLSVPPDRLAAFAAYDGGRLARLDTLLGTAMNQEDAAFDAGLEEALRFVPKLLRPAAKKLLFGGSHG
jgi:hypothetical protein